jgi:hypothetical protein
MIDVDHRCEDSDCIYLGQRTRGVSCKCHKTREQMLEAEVIRLRAAVPQCDVQTDYVLMPREATRAMTMAGCDSLPACEHVFGHAGEMLRNAYRKMVEVASLVSSAERA